MLNLTIDSLTSWCDSEVALAWMCSPTERWKPFVRSCVNEIQHLVEHSAWQRCPGTQNLAVVRGCGNWRCFPYWAFQFHRNRSTEAGRR
ncbi:hypothetical protein T12_7811 [Trichinella patagoniensis]|uniref:Uncharacterized protein n=1 Tax=Trichinella patagoniensis TaxID=990121 RepID=A0A0V0Z2B9_9BILA|nr:hypothetical protein T12_7811 [Trichinella patagoniensis]